MFGKIATLGATLALMLSAGVFAAPSKTASCCVEKTRCCSMVKACCGEPEKAACCKTGASCCDKQDRCGSRSAKSAAGLCPITGKPLTQCCSNKASQTPPCCQKGCKHAGRIAH